MKRLIFCILFYLLVTSIAQARSTGCKEGNCENGYGKWIYTDKTTYEGEWVATKKHGQGVETWPTDIFTKANLKIANGAVLELYFFPMAQLTKVNGPRGL